MTTSYEIGLSDFIKRLASLGGDVEAATVRGLQSAALRFDARVAHEITNSAPSPAVDRGELINSRQVTMTPKGAQHAVLAPHAAAINDGTRPFWPPFQPIYDWVVRKKLAEDGEEATQVTNRIRGAIAKRGIKPRHYYDKAWAWFIQGKYVGREIGRELELLAQKRGQGREDAETRRGSGLKDKPAGGE